MFSFLSVEFALLFMVFFMLYWAFKKRPDIQNMLLLIISYAIIYLMAGLMAVGMLFIFSIVIYFIARQIIISRHKKSWMAMGVIITLINLSVFKYYEFFRANISRALEMWQLDNTGLMANIIFPLGISYYSFQAISYLATLYQQTKNNHQPQTPLSLWQSLTYFSFFATISSGPITRVAYTKGLKDITGKECAMYDQLNEPKPRQLLYPKIAFALIVLALAKKWWLAGYLADNWVNPVFANPTGFHSLEVLTAIYGYTLQLFLDFSGYSEMMVAFGLLLGFRLPMNFNAPLLAHNIRDFWDRWHISLSTWIRDYIYIPLGGSRKGFWFTQLNLIIAMVLSGIWHGSTFNFFFWGLLHALAIALLNTGDLACQKISGHDKGRNFLANTGIIGKTLGVLITVHFVVFAFVFFRATTLDEALLIFNALFFNHINVAWTNNPIYLLAILTLAWLIYPLFHRHQTQVGRLINKMPSVIFYVLCFMVFMAVVILAPSGIPGFIYANF
ncbi:MULTISPECIES: MBOAT family protein [Moraxella]|uniref:MBOAT family O-acyltransferase n=1 Tax=Moraxella TaxID=475 RepID=UPI00187EA907|nr:MULTISPECIES: MBOAT family protein [Moraxella]MBE9578932.1 MBOAT family protein [Moraxella sp. K1664]MBE9588276.1 MBOAT family protein [Moraxella sp. K1630]MBE9596416.1 MBOAT family protein [Moraxella sp. K2450]MDH9218782.1 MBOAT family protein [Moraxella lacunata]